jgi:prephenate dehydrogenase
VDNAPAIVAGLDAVLADLSVMRDRVATQARDEILVALQQASAARRSLPGPSVRPAELSEVRILVPDREGVLARLTSLASDLGINIYDVEIAHSAEGSRGVLVLVVDRREAARLRATAAAAGFPGVDRSLE